jgi:uncharacterized protein YfkK (UPF0435 family)
MAADAEADRVEAEDFHRAVQERERLSCSAMQAGRGDLQRG